MPYFGCEWMNAECTPAVTPSVNSLSAFGWRGSCVSAMTMPFFRSAAPSRVMTSVFPSGVVMMSLIDRAFTMIESTIVGFAGFEMSTA